MALQQVSAEQTGYWMAFPMSSPPLVDAICSPKGKGGDLSTSVDDSPVKVRKPYTITKQRERWTEDEHQKFLDALKLHGRAWRRIEEHIGTKTAVQIRSHAQKFFSKLEREASLGGPLTTTGSGEIEIPPPRPKRKPSHPYPKKASGAFSGSPSFEEDCKSPPAVHSAFTPLESGTGTSISKMPSKKNGSSAASLRLFGQTFVPGSDKVEADTDLMESTGSPRSQISVETEETSGISPLVSNTASGVWDQNDSVSKPHETAGASSGTNSQLCKAIAEWEKSLIAVHAPKIDHSNENNAPSVSSAYDCHSDASCFTPWQPSSFSLGEHNLAQFSSCVPAFWQGLVPPSFTHGTSEDMNTAAAIAAATYAVASAWHAIQGALANASNDSNTSVVYSPIAMLAAATQPISISRPQSPDAHAHDHVKRKQGGSYSGSGNEDEGNSMHGEESTAECCSSLTDTSRLSSYESNDEGVAKKCCRKFYDDDMHHDKEAPESLKILTCERISKVEQSCSSSEGLDISHRNNGAVAIHSRSTDDHMDGPSDEARIANSSVNKSLQPENDIVSMDADQQIDLIIQAFRLNSPLEIADGSLKEREIADGSLKERGAPKDSNDTDKEIVSSSTLSESKANTASISKECLNTSLHDDSGLQTGGNGTCIESEHLFMIKAGATLSSRYSGVGFVPYKKSIKVESSNKHED